MIVHFHRSPSQRLVLFTALLCLLAVTNGFAQTLLDKIGIKGKGTGTTATLAALTDDQVAAGLKEALGKGVQQAVAQLGKQGGFLTNGTVKIPMPESLQKVEKSIRTLKQGALADEFITTMNRAAEQAVPQAAAIFSDGIKQMSITDAKAILTGPEDSATQYFRKTGTNALHAAFLPIVKQATEKAGVTAAYKNMMAKAGGGALGKSFGGTLSAFGVSQDAADVDGYVTRKAMDGLFKMVAEEENRIRQNPVARSTDVLKKVFGAVGK